ncbi:MAG: DUF262 domain-containing protein [Calditrichaeota bacterium]|nr:DUF262 domain-containing protein [Calditrichota bacterium]
MSLTDEIKKARTEIVSDGYEMSVGEIINLYHDYEIFINPEFQRLFRWDKTRKTKFIESLLLGIPIPPIFVYHDENGVWELIDGLQRLSTIFEFVGILRKNKTEKYAPSVLEGTRLLPSMVNKRWTPSSPKAKNGLDQPSRIQIKRARIRVEILKQESDPQAKYELFQRLNTGGMELSEQEVRNCILVMLNKTLFDWISEYAAKDYFRNVIAQTTDKISKQMEKELVLRFIVFRNIKYTTGLEVHKYLEESMIKIALDSNFNLENEGYIFEQTFKLLNETSGSKSFKRWNAVRNDFTGKFLMSVFEVVSIGLSKNLDSILKLKNKERKIFLARRRKSLGNNPTFIKYSGMGISGKARLSKLLPMAEGFMKP